MHVQGNQDTEVRTLVDVLASLDMQPAEQICDVSPSMTATLRAIGSQLSIFPREQLISAQDWLSKKLQCMADARARGQSDYNFFALLRLQKAVSRLLDNSSAWLEPATLTLALPTAIGESVIIPTKPSISGHPLAGFIQTAMTSSYFGLAYPEQHGIPATIPSMFVLNGGLLERLTQDHSQVNILSGHCLLNVDAWDGTLIDLVSLMRRGLLLHDVLIYRHVTSLVNALGSQAHRIDVALDTMYYMQKAFNAPHRTAPAQRTNELLAEMADRQAKDVRALVPSCTVMMEHLPPYRDMLEQIVSQGLYQFVSKSVHEFMGQNLTREPEKAKAASYVAATYLVSPLIYQEPVIAIESALNIDAVARIVLPYLEMQGLQDLFAFIGLFPLRDLKMAHGAMHYGNAQHGKLYSSDSEAQIGTLISEMSRNPSRPERCWYVNYYWAKNGAAPEGMRCHSSLCLQHQQELTHDVLESVCT